MDKNFLFHRLEAVNKAFFNLPETPKIKWSKGQIKKRYRKITYGCYDIKKNEIRIHPILKNKEYPPYVIDFVIYHELLHYVDRELLKEKKSFFKFVRRTKIHNKEFKKKELAFPYAEEAKRELNRIIESRN
jgi:predicted metal-dependent hydrolase